MVLVSPSSLIFVAVVVTWAAYLVIHVARRREHLATARTVDRFSSQMRVLQRRAVRLDAPTPSTVRVSSASLTRRPLVAQTGVEELFSGGAAEATPEPALTASESVAAAEPVAVRVQRSTLADETDLREGPTAEFFLERPARPQRGLGRLRPTSRPAPQTLRVVRAGALLAGVVSLLAVAVAVLASALPAWALTAPALLLVVVLAWLRAAARASAAQRRRAAARRRRERDRREREDAQRRRDARPSAPQLPVAQEFVAPTLTMPVVAEAAQLTEREAYDVAAPAASIASAASAASAVSTAPLATGAIATRLDPLEVAALAHSDIDAGARDPLFDERGWEPTPVPPPTYTLKAKAQHPLPPPMQVPVPIEIEDDDIAWDVQRHQPRVVSA